MNRKTIFQACLSLICSLSVAQEMDLSVFQMSSNSSPAFMLVEESPTAIYMPTSFRKLVVHTVDNLKENVSLEVVPFLLSKPKNQTYYKYIGVYKNKDSILKQDPLSGIWNTLSVSLAYVDKEFLGIGGKRKTASIGINTTLLRFYNKQKIYDNAQAIGDVLASITVPREILAKQKSDSTAIPRYYKSIQKEINKKLEPYSKPIKPIFRLDAALGYGMLFNDDDAISASTADRFGSWLTAEFSYRPNEDNPNYINILAVARYVEDEYNINGSNEFYTKFYRDFGGKIEFEHGKLAFSYEYISRNGDISSTKSMGNFKYKLNSDIVLTGGFGKDFFDEDKIISVIGIDWGLSLGGKTLPVE